MCAGRVSMIETRTTMDKSDSQLKSDIEAELGWDPMVNAAQIGVTVNQGAVSLLGTVDTYAQKWAAEDATQRVNGVRAVAQDLTVKLLTEHRHNDSEIAAAALHALKWDVSTPAGITASVRDGIVTLEGEVTWNYQRESAEYAIRRLAGVVDVNSRIHLKPQVSATEVKMKVEAALRRQATADANSIRVETAGGKVTLSGEASSWKSLKDAAQAAWAAPGVTEVVDHMKVSLTN